MSLQIGQKVERTCPLCKKVKTFTVTEWNQWLKHWVLRAPTCDPEESPGTLMILNERP